MIKLDLKTKNKEQELIKEYLENNASEVLANKINNGTTIIKDNKTLINKKDLDSFMIFATNEAKKLVENNANCACVEDKTVYGWAIHYFEEDSIEGKLYNEDGSEYKPIIKVSESTTKQEDKNQNKQESLFDLLDVVKSNENKENNAKNTENENKYLEVNGCIIEKETGEIIKEIEPKPTFDKENAIILYNLLDKKLKI